jgi:hypothetical protein
MPTSWTPSPFRRSSTRVGLSTSPHTCPGAVCHQTLVRDSFRHTRVFLTRILSGPKMYCAYASGARGSTRLHMDLSGAYNVLLHSSNGENDVAAEWLIFQSEDASHLREYMRSAIPGIERDEDPINSQRHFLTTKDLKALKKLRILPTIIHQKVGDAVIIPAHCPHQVYLSA